MADNMPLSRSPLTLIVAATTRNGIGKNGGLPWPMLKKDMAYFARVTKRVPRAENKAKETDSRRNVVIMGRKTWDSIPPKFRPLKDRTHIVISSQDRSKMEPVPEDVVVASNIVSGLRKLERPVQDGKVQPLGRAFVIGGSSIYKMALELPQTSRILLTRIDKEFECDTFFPEPLSKSDVSGSTWRRATHAELEEHVGEDVEQGDVEDGDVCLQFQLYQRA
jgi:dihydrofolate reductase